MTNPLPSPPSAFSATFGLHPRCRRAVHCVDAMERPLSPRSPRSPRISEKDGAAVPAVFPFGSLPAELLSEVLAQLPLDSRARAACVARAWRKAARLPEANWLQLDLSARATADWTRTRLTQAVVRALLLHAATFRGGGARSLDLSGQAMQSDVNASWLYDLLAEHASFPGGGTIRGVTAPCAFWPASAAAVCHLLPSLDALTVSVSAAGSETGESLIAMLKTPALRCSSFTLSSRVVLCPPPEQLAAALAPHMRWLQKLDLSASGLRDAHIEAIAPLLRGAQALEILDLSENACTAACMAQLVQAVLPAEGSSLHTLDLSGNMVLQPQAGQHTALVALLDALLAQHETALRRGPPSEGRGAPHPLRRLVVQCCAPLEVLAYAKEQALPSTTLDFGFNSHTWRLWGAV